MRGKGSARPSSTMGTKEKEGVSGLTENWGREEEEERKEKLSLLLLLLIACHYALTFLPSLPSDVVVALSEGGGGGVSRCENVDGEGKSERKRISQGKFDMRAA